MVAGRRNQSFFPSITSTNPAIIRICDSRREGYLEFAVVTTAGYVGFLAGPPLIGFVAQLSTIRAALWILVVLSGLSAFASTSMKKIGL
jgi:MFS family permease